MFHDPAAHVAKFEGMGHHGVTVVEQDATDTSLSITITREVDVDGIPGFAKKFLSPRNTVVSVDTWTDNGDGTYSGQYTLDTKGTPIEISGNTRLDPDTIAYAFGHGGAKLVLVDAALIPLAEAAIKMMKGAAPQIVRTVSLA